MTSLHSITTLSNQLHKSSSLRSHHLVTLSAKEKDALRNLAQSYCTAFAETADSLADIGFTTQTRRSHFHHRLAIVAESLGDLRQKLQHFLDSKKHPSIFYQQVSSQAETTKPIAFLFTGQGSQYVEMGKVLYETQPTFRRILKQCDEILQDYLKLPLLSVLYPEEDSTHLHQTAYTQPALFALEYALASLWQSYGIVPDAVMGHSVGEYAAACIAGVFSFEDGIKLIAKRGRLIQTLPKNGMMAAVFASEAQILPLIEPYRNSVAIATINGSTNVVISGLQEKVEEVLEKLRQQSIQFRQLKVSHAFHSPLMEPILDSFATYANTISFDAPQIPLLSNVTGQFWRSGEIPDADYWVRHLRGAVRFSDGMKKLTAEGYGIFMEMGPNPTLLNMGQRCISDSSALWLPSLKRGQTDWLTLLSSVGQLYVRNATIDWSKFYQDYQQRVVRLPNYPFQRRNYRELVKKPLPEAKSQNADSSVNKFQHPWFYQWQWQAEESSSSQDLAPGAIVIFGDETSGDRITPDIDRDRYSLYWVLPGESFSQSAHKFTLNPQHSQDYEQLINAIGSEGQPIVAVLHLWNKLHYAKDEPRAEAVMAESAYSTLFLAQALFKYCSQDAIAFLLLTVSNYAINSVESIQGTHQAVGATFLQSLSQEYANLKTKVVDLLPEDLQSEQWGQRLWQELLIPPQGEGIIAFRGKQRWSRTLGQVAAAPQKAIAQTLKAGDTYLITGGTSAVASEIATGLLAHAPLNLVLTGRQALPPQEQWDDLVASEHPQSKRIQTIQKLEQLGATLLYEAVDVTNEAQMTSLMSKVRTRFGQLDGVIHAAGVIDRQNLNFSQKSLATVASVFAPKIQGTVTLDRLTRSEPLKFFIMISSAAASKAVWGGNLSDYAAANAFLDNYALYRSQKSAPGRSLAINFTLWRDRGMATLLGQASLELMAKATGMNLLDPQQAVNSFIDALSIATPAVTHVIDFIPSVSQPAPNPSAIAEEIRFEPNTATTDLEELVKEVICEHIVLSVEQIEGHENLGELGLDSLSGIEVIQQLNQKLDLQLSPTILFEYPDLNSLVQYLSKKQKSSNSEARTPQIEIATEKKPTTTDIAIISMACNAPGASNLTEYWQLLSQGRSAINTVPSSRWSKDYFDQTKQTSYKTYSHWGGFIDNPYDFDPLFFGISPKEAMAMDPQQRVFLALAWQVLFASGYGSKSRPQDIAVFVGCGQNNYAEHFLNYQSYGILSQRLENSEWFHHLSQNNRQALHDTLIDVLQPSEIISETAAGNEMNQLAARISHCLDLTGPSLSVSTACSSSLVALHLACDSLRSGQSSMAIVGGVNLNLSPTALTFLSRVQALSETGTCYPFDSRANGMVVGEGAGAVLLKPVDKAIADGDRILATIKGSAINNDGHSQGITAPKPQGQAQATRQAYQKFGINPDTITYIETHGTGTSLGDPIEVSGMTQAFGTFTENQQFCGIGSVKSSIGHALAASGILSVIKVVLAMQHQYIPGTKGYQNPNPNIDFARTPFYVVGEGKAWSDREQPLRAGVNGFGFGGTNAHIILEQAPKLSPSPKSEPKNDYSLLCLTARNQRRLQIVAEKLREHLIAHPEQKLDEVCFTLNNAQKEFPSKAALVVKDRQQLLEQLQAIANNNSHSAVYLGRANLKLATPLSIILDNTSNVTVEDIATIGQRFPVWRSAYEECQSLWQSFIKNTQSSSKVHHFATQYAYLSWLKSLDIEPQELIVTGIGILVGSCFTGLVTLEEALAALARLKEEKLVIPLQKAEKQPISASWDCPLVTPKGIFNPTARVSSLQLSALIQLGGSFNLSVKTKKSQTVCLYLGNSDELVRLGKDDCSLIWHSPKSEVKEMEIFTTMARLYVAGVAFNSSRLFRANTRRVPLFIYPFDNKPYKATIVKSVSTTENSAEALLSQELQETDTVPLLSSQQRQQSYLTLTKTLGLK